MSFVHGKDSQLLVAEFNLGAAIVKQFTVAVEAATEDTTTIGDDNVERWGPGQFDGSAAFSGLFDLDYDDDLAGYIGGTAGQPVTAIFGTPAEGSYARLGSLHVARYEISNPVGGMIGVQATLTPEDGFRFGQVLTPLASKGTSSNSSSQDRLNALTAATTGGALAAIHCTAVDTLTSLDVDIEDSTNDSVWASLASFTQLTDVGSEVISVAAGTTIDRYVRAAWTLVGTAATFTVAFARYE